jgi:phenylalanyl-tRNA synthetase beta chain
VVKRKFIMPTVILNKTVLEKLIGKKLPLDKLKDRISMLGTDLESIEGDEIKVEIFPNRPDLLSEQGFGRAFSSFIGIKTGLRKYDVKKSGYKVIVDKSVSMRPYTACALIKNIKFTDERIREIMQMQEKLATTHGRNRIKSAYGVYPIDKVTFPITYIAKDPKKVMFHPLGFEKKIVACDVEELHPTGSKFKHIANGWKKYPFFIDAKENVMCMLPYTNSHDTGKVELNTKEVFIECTGTDLENVNVALNMFVTMFADMGAEIHSLDIVYPNKTITTPNLIPKKKSIELSYVNKHLGLELKEKELKVLLEKMGYGYEMNKNTNNDKIKGTVLIPPYRADILHQVDFIEDIAIAYGYENFEETIPNVATIAQENKFEKFKSKIAESLVGLGLIETSSYNLIHNITQTTKMNLKKDKLSVLQVFDPVSEEYNSLRTWIIPCLMQILNDNKHNELPQNIFEIGNIFKKGKISKDNQTGVIEEQRLGVLLCNADIDYTKIKQVLDYLLRMLDVEYKIEDYEHESFIPGRAGRTISNNKKVAIIGEIQPQVLENFELDMPVSVFELNLTELFNLIKD